MIPEWVTSVTLWHGRGRKLPTCAVRTSERCYKHGLTREESLWFARAVNRMLVKGVGTLRPFMFAGLCGWVWKR